MIARFQILNDNFSPTMIKGDIVEGIRVEDFQDLEGVYVIKEADSVTIQRIESSSEIDFSLVIGIYKIERLVSRSLVVGGGCMWLD